jgi:hypothetical protein
VKNERKKNFVELFSKKIKSTEESNDTRNREIGSCVNVNEVNVPEITNAEIRKYSHYTLD